MVKIVDFRARTDRVIYILSDHGRSYAVINNDENLTEGADTLIKRGRRDILFARLRRPWTDLIEITGNHYNLYQGLSYNHQMKVVQGDISPNDINGYSTSVEKVVPVKSVPKVVSSLNSNVMDVLEDLLVPENVAKQMRAYIKATSA